jgi:hypothetical protein
MSDPFAAFDLAEAQDYLTGFDRRLRKQGERLYQLGRVGQLKPAPDGLGVEAKVQEDGLVHGVSLAFDLDFGWEGDCTCLRGEDCEHVYAVMRATVAELNLAAVRGLSAGQAAPARPAPGRGARARTLRFPEVPLSEFGEEVAARLGRRLRPPERAFLQKLHAGYEQVRAGRGFTRWDFEQLGLGLGGNGWEAVELWPRRPASEKEFWHYVANAALEHGREIPEFLAPLTDLTEARQQLARWRRQRAIEQWTERLRNPAHPEGSGPATVRGTYDLRLVLRPMEAVPECQRPGQDKFEALKPMQWQQLAQDYRASRLDFTPEAERIWQGLQLYILYGRRLPIQYTEPDLPGFLGRLLRAPGLEGRIVTAAGQPYRRAPEPLRWEVSSPADDTGDYRFRLLQADGQPLPPVLCVLDGHPPLYVTDDTFFAGPPPVPDALDPNREIAIPAPALETSPGLGFLETLGVELPARIRDRIRRVPYEIAIRCELRPIYPGSPTENCLFQVCAEATDASRREHWNGQHWALDNPKRAAKRAADSTIVLYDQARLREVPQWFEPLGLKLDPYSGRLALRVNKKFPELFVPWLKSLPADVRVQLDGELASLAGDAVSGRVRLEATEAEIDWFDLRVVLDVSDTTLTPAEIKLLLNAKGRFVRLADKGWRRLEFNLSAEEDEQLARLGLSPHELTAETQRLHALQLADHAARKFLPEPQVEKIERRVADLKTRVTPPLPPGVTAALRPYQLEGFHFLAYLAANRFGGILADDMGLGKTLQALAWLLWLRQGHAADQVTGLLGSPSDSSASPSPPAALASPGSPSVPAAMPAVPPALVVCPKSVMDNWRAEVERFTPGLRVRTWRADELADFHERLGEGDLHVLNYSQLRLLGEGLTGVHWLAVILDEGQYIKNPSSQTAQVARALKATHRLVLSGTPIENRLLDLWSLLTFAMPGVLSSRHHFARVYDAKGDPLARRRLAARVRPFLLRRTKGQVAQDLPARVEEDLFCEIEGEQQALYRAELKRARQILLRIQTPQELAREQFHFLTSLLRLRQICCHPRLVKPDSIAESAKVTALLDQLEPLMEEGHKVLVFSQFVELLGLLKPVFAARGWQHFYLAGETENRGELVESFQTAAGAAIFLISLKAGGFGLNLTAASYVVLFDPWWNPAVENQAIDRTHRIGQRNPVMAYRLLIKNSIEEKIRLLQKQKRALAEDVLGEERFAQSLSLDDLRFLFAED